MILSIYLVLLSVVFLQEHKVGVLFSLRGRVTSTLNVWESLVKDANFLLQISTSFAIVGFQLLANVIECVWSLFLLVRCVYQIPELALLFKCKQEFCVNMNHLPVPYLFLAI
jgi:hypothetical protein